LVAAWLAARGAGDVGDTVEWLYAYGVSAALVDALAALLERIWIEGWQLGEDAARQILSLSSSLPGQALEDLLRQLGYEWVAQIARTLIQGIAEILAKGGTQAELEAAIQAFLSNLDNAKRIVQTELTRAINAAATAFYRMAKIRLVRWLTEHDARVCPACDENEAAGPWPLGHPFPAGALFPPQHPRCRCALIPA
jgi:SPP1 gp7 family putative phage head morphogenesis protein